jgi:hypothetical protein
MLMAKKIALWRKEHATRLDVLAINRLRTDIELAYGGAFPVAG